MNLKWVKIQIKQFTYVTAFMFLSVFVYASWLGTSLDNFKAIHTAEQKEAIHSTEVRRTGEIIVAQQIHKNMQESVALKVKLNGREIQSVKKK